MRPYLKNSSQKKAGGVAQVQALSSSPRTAKKKGKKKVKQYTTYKTVGILQESGMVYQNCERKTKPC
jgi:hypothetical protein